MGYKMADTPMRWCRPSRDPEKQGWVECIVGAHWKHDGPVAVISADHLVRKQEEEQRIGAGQATGDGGVNEFLRKHPNVPILGGAT